MLEYDTDRVLSRGDGRRASPKEIRSFVSAKGVCGRLSTLVAPYGEIIRIDVGDAAHIRIVTVDVDLRRRILVICRRTGFPLVRGGIVSILKVIDLIAARRKGPARAVDIIHDIDADGVAVAEPVRGHPRVRHLVDAACQADRKSVGGNGRRLDLETLAGNSDGRNHQCE